MPRAQPGSGTSGRSTQHGRSRRPRTAPGTARGRRRSRRPAPRTAGTTATTAGRPAGPPPPARPHRDEQQQPRFVVKEATMARPIAQPHQATGWRSRASQDRSAAAGSRLRLRRTTATAPARRGARRPGRVAPRPGARRHSDVAGSTGSSRRPASVVRSVGVSVDGSVGRPPRLGGRSVRRLRLLGPDGRLRRSRWASAPGVGVGVGVARASASGSGDGVLVGVGVGVMGVRWTPGVDGVRRRGAVPDHRDVPAGGDVSDPRRARSSSTSPVVPSDHHSPSRRRRAGCSRTGRRRTPSMRQTKPGNRWT